MVTFNYGKIASKDPKVAAAHAYEGWLNYAERQLAAPAYAQLLVELANVGLPADSDKLLTLPDGFRRVFALQGAIGFFLSQKPVNAHPISTLDLVLQDLDAQAMSVEGNVTLLDRLTVAGASVLGGSLKVAGALTIAGDAEILGGLQLERLGVGVAAPASGIAVAGPIRASSLRITASVEPSAAADGTIGEDSNGDVFFKRLDGTVVYLSRQTHDTGWINMLDANLVAAGVGVTGVHNPDPALTPDILNSTPLTFGADEPGDLGGVSRIQAWLRCDTDLIDGSGAAPTGDYYYFMLGVYFANGQQGATAVARSSDRRCELQLGTGNLVAGQATTNVNSLRTNATFAALADLRWLMWVR